MEAVEARTRVEVKMGIEVKTGVKVTTEVEEKTKARVMVTVVVSWTAVSFEKWNSRLRSTRVRKNQEDSQRSPP